VLAGGRPVRPGINGQLFDKDALKVGDALGDEHDAYNVSHAWYCYSQEPIPLCGDMPGSTREITDRTLQRKPRNMTTLIFRHYPAMGRRYHAERLQQEGWYDGEGWDVSERDDNKGWRTVGLELRRQAPQERGRVGGGRKWSEEAWVKAREAWREHGEKNKIWFQPGSPEEQNLRDQARAFWKSQADAARYVMPTLSPLATRREKRDFHDTFPMPRKQDEAQMSEEQRQQLRAAQFMFEWRFYRQVSNFDAHYQKAVAESPAAAVAVRKLFYEAEDLQSSGSPFQARAIYEKKRTFGQDRVERTVLEAWRDLVLLKNQRYRDLDDTQQFSAEVQINYLELVDGKSLRDRLVVLSGLVPLVPPLVREDASRPLVPGPLDMTDEEGEPLISTVNMERTLERKGLLRRPPRPPSGGR
jgi:hypothetical protein